MSSIQAMAVQVSKPKINVGGKTLTVSTQAPQGNNLPNGVSVLRVANDNDKDALLQVLADNSNGPQAQDNNNNNNNNNNNTTTTTTVTTPPNGWLQIAEGDGEPKEVKMNQLGDAIEVGSLVVLEKKPTGEIIIRLFPASETDKLTGELAGTSADAGQVAANTPADQVTLSVLP